MKKKFFYNTIFLYYCIKTCFNFESERFFECHMLKEKKILGEMSWQHVFASNQGILKLSGLLVKKPPRCKDVSGFCSCSPCSPHCLINMCGGILEQLNLSCSWTRKVDQKVLQEQFLCPFWSGCIYLNNFSEFIEAMPIFLNFLFVCYCLIFFNFWNFVIKFDYERALKQMN